ncbi:MAG: hypothetical protein ACXVGH_13420, partial [Mycobacteriales bacterium]
MTSNALALDLPGQRPGAEAPPAGRPFTHDLAVVGMGYVGLPTALTLHAAGLSVLGVDSNPRRLHMIRDLSADQLESDRERLRDALHSDRFELTSDLERLGSARHVVICVPTPLDDHLLPDLALLRGACDTVVQEASPGQVIV